MSLTPEMIADGWIKHDGGPCPVPLDSIVDVMIFSRQTGNFFACNLLWEHDGRQDDIIAYRPESPSHDQ